MAPSKHKVEQQQLPEASFWPKHATPEGRFTDSLSKKKNKLFINMFSGSLERPGCWMHPAYDDAYVLIMGTALKIAETCTVGLLHVIVFVMTHIGWYTVRVLICHRTTIEQESIFSHPDQKFGQHDRYTDIHQVRSAQWEEVCRNLLFVYAILGCDTTSRLSAFGKAIGLAKLIKNRRLPNRQRFSTLGVAPSR